MQWWVSGFLVFILSASQVWAKADYGRISDSDLKRVLNSEMRSHHHAVGYKQARIELLGRISLEKDSSGSYVIHDVYCEELYGSSRFKGGGGPAPGRIPDDRVLNTEHTWPQSRFGGSSRDTQKSDLHHLFPSDSQLNAVRGNHPFGEVSRNPQVLKCPISKAGYNTQGEFVFEPPEAHRGNVARALFYFAVRYDMSIDATQEQILKKWNQQDPVDSDETLRNDEIEKVQGNRNPFIDNPELADRISNF